MCYLMCGSQNEENTHIIHVVKRAVSGNVVEAKILPARTNKATPRFRPTEE